MKVIAVLVDELPISCYECSLCEDMEGTLICAASWDDEKQEYPIAGILPIGQPEWCKLKVVQDWHGEKLSELANGRAG